MDILETYWKALKTNLYSRHGLTIVRVNLVYLPYTLKRIVIISFCSHWICYEFKDDNPGDIPNSTAEYSSHMIFCLGLKSTCINPISTGKQIHNGWRVTKWSTSGSVEADEKVSVTNYFPESLLFKWRDAFQQTFQRYTKSRFPIRRVGLWSIMLLDIIWLKNAYPVQNNNLFAINRFCEEGNYRTNVCGINFD
jgi:hypothetical protein